MGRRLILDTTVLIELERGRVDRAQFDEDQLLIAAISVAEFRAGAERAETAQRRESRLAALKMLLEVVGVLDYTLKTAEEHGRLLAYTRRSGRPRGRHDLIIAAHSAETRFPVLSHDASARFGELPAVTTAGLPR